MPANWEPGANQREKRSLEKLRLLVYSSHNFPNDQLQTTTTTTPKMYSTTNENNTDTMTNNIKHFHFQPEEVQQQINQAEEDDSSFVDLLSAVTAEYYLDENDLRPGGEFIKGYTELRPYKKTAYSGITLKKTRNGHRAKSGVRLESSISPVHQRPGVVSNGK
jgi:hypothetical protein